MTMIRLFDECLNPTEDVVLVHWNFYTSSGKFIDIFKEQCTNNLHWLASLDSALTKTL